MSFLYPTFLYALGAVAVPILIHFLNFYRIKKIEISTIRFLEETKEQRNKWLKLKEWLVLFLRVLAIVFLVLAFAQPYWEEDKSSFSAQELLFIDNKLASSVSEDDYSLLNQQLNLAVNHVSNAKPGAVFKVITHDFEKDPSLWLGKAQAIEYINTIVPSKRSNPWEAVLKRAKASLSNQQNGVPFYVYSDFNKQYFNTYFAEYTDSTFHYQLLPVQAQELSNIAIDSIWVASPVFRTQQSNTLFVRVKYYGQSGAKAANLTFQLNNKTVASSKVELEGNGEQEKVVTFDFIVPQSGWNKGELLLDDLPVYYDNQFYFAFKALDELRVALVLPNTNYTSYLPQVYAQESLFNVSVSTLQKPNFEEIKSADLLILEAFDAMPSYFVDVVNKHRSKGGSVVFIPRGDKNDEKHLLTLGVSASYSPDTSLVAVTISDLESPLFSDVFVSPKRNASIAHAQQSLRLARGKQVLKYKNGLPYLLIDQEEERGNLYVFAAPITKQYSDLQHKAIVVPLFYNMAFLSSRSKQPLYTTFNQPFYQLTDLDNDERSNYALQSNNASLPPIFPEQYKQGSKMVLNLNECDEEGLYSVLSNDSLKAIIGLNIPKTLSNVQTYSREELIDFAANKATVSVEEFENDLKYETFVNAQEGSSLWKYCLILMFLSLIAEMAVIKFF